MEIESSLRASDADREQVAERLRHATAEGRLSSDELEGRLQDLFAARTYGELDALLADLPVRPSLRKRPVRVRRWAAAVGALMLALLALAVLAIARVHAAAGVAGGGPGGGGELRFRPPLPDPQQALIVAVSMVGVFAVLLLGSASLWLFMQSRGGVGRLSGPTSRFR